MIYAKSNPIETLREHTNNLLKELESNYKENIEVK